MLGPLAMLFLVPEWEVLEVIALVHVKTFATSAAKKANQHLKAPPANKSARAHNL